MKNKTLVRFCISAVIAALYAAVSLALAPLSFGPIQIRIAEAMTLLPILFPEAIAGVTLGCFLTNLIGAILGVNLLGFFDVFAGTLATFLAAMLTWRCRKLCVKGVPLVSALMPETFFKGRGSYRHNHKFLYIQSGRQCVASTVYDIHHWNRKTVPGSSAKETVKRNIQ